MHYEYTKNPTSQRLLIRGRLAGWLAQASGIDSIYKCLSAQVLNPGPYNTSALLPFLGLGIHGYLGEH